MENPRSIFKRASTINVHDPNILPINNKLTSKEHCGICLVQLIDDQIRVKLVFCKQCKYSFHLECAICLRSDICPNCRTKFSRDDKIYDITHIFEYIKKPENEETEIEIELTL